MKGKVKCLNRAKKIARDIYSQDKKIRNIISIYTMGSFAEGTADEESDIDLNIFLKETDFESIDFLRKSILNTEKKFKIRIDNNIISLLELSLYNQIIFPHKFRHAPLIYEIKFYDALLAGKDILKNLKINKKEMKTEAIKHLLVLRYRIRKLYLAGKSISEAKRQAMKFCIYSAKYALISKGIFEYETKRAIKRFLQEFDLEDKEILMECYKIQRNRKKIYKRDFSRAVNFIENISNICLRRYLAKNEKE
jgi:predicted nucleotidyltransferase